MGYLLKIPHDKLLHFSAGVLVYLAFHFIDVQVGLIAALVVAVGKEIYDHKQDRKPDFNDALATMLGGLTGFICGI